RLPGVPGPTPRRGPRPRRGLRRPRVPPQRDPLALCLLPAALAAGFKVTPTLVGTGTHLPGLTACRGIVLGLVLAPFNRFTFPRLQRAAIRSNLAASRDLPLRSGTTQWKT